MGPPIEANDPVLRDFFFALIKGAGVPELKEALQILLVEDRDHSLLWKIVGQVFDLIHAGLGGGPLGEIHQKELNGKSAHQISKIRAQWRKEFYRAKQMGLYLMAHGGQSRIAEGLIRSMVPAVRQYREYLESHSDRVLDAMRFESLAYGARAFYEDQDLEAKARLNHLMEDALETPERAVNLLAVFEAMDRDPGIPHRDGRVSRFSVFWDRFSLMRDDQAYQDLQISRLFTDILHFMQERSPDSVGRETARHIRHFVADRLDRGEIEQMLLLMSKRRTINGRDVTFNSVLNTAAEAIENGKLKDFFARSRRALGN